MFDKNTKRLSQSHNWNTLVHNIQNSLGRSYEYSEGDEASYVDLLYEDSGSDPNQMVQFCQHELEVEGAYEETWARIKAAAVVLTRMGQGHLSVDASDDLYDDVILALWRAAERCGVESWQTLGHDREDGWINWQQHKYALDSIFFALANIEPAERRMERFFNSQLTTYWKAFYIDWGIVWHNTSPEAYLSDGGHRLNHKIVYYALLAFRLAHFDTEFERHTHKVTEGVKRLTQKPDDIPADRTLRKQIYAAMTHYLQGQQVESTQIFNEVFNVLRYDTIGFILSDPQYQQLEVGKLLLATNEILENTWESHNRLRGRILPAVLAATTHADAQVRRQAKSFLKVRAPHEIQDQIEGLINKLDSTANQEKVSDFISNLIEFGSQVAIKAVLRKCVIWIANDENWILIDRAAQKLCRTPTAVQPLVYQLNMVLEDEQVRELLRGQVLAEQHHFVLNALFHPNNGPVNGFETTTEHRSDAGLGQTNPASNQEADTAYDRFEALTANGRQQKYVDALEKWSRSFESRAKPYADHIARWQEGMAQSDKGLQASASVDLAEKILNLLTGEKIQAHHLKVQRWITEVLSRMSDRRYFEKEPELYGEMSQTLQKFAVEPLSKRLPTEEDLESRENIVRVLGNIGGPAAVDALVRTVSGKERERKARQALLAAYYLEPSKKQSEEAAALLNDAVDNAKKTMRLLQVLNAATFVLGAILVLAGVFIAVISEELGTRFVGFFSGLGGIGAIVTVFLKDPLRRIQNAMGDLVQIQTAFTGFVWDLNLNGTYIQSQYVAEGILTDYDIRQTTGRIDDSIDKTMRLIQIYAEGEYEDAQPRLDYILPQDGGQLVTLLGENLGGISGNEKKVSRQVVVNHRPADLPIERWTDHYVIVRLTPEEMRDKQTGQGNGTGRLWISLRIDGRETNALPFSEQAAVG